jgi:hypothetical protein
LTVRVDETAREPLLLETAALRDALTDPGARASYDELSRAVVTGEVPDELVAPLERVLEIGLRTGRVRRLHGVHAESALARVFHGTPKGRALGAAVGEVNTALEALAGQPLERLSLNAKGPGAYALTIETGAATLTLEIGPEGVAVKDVSVGA